MKRFSLFFVLFLCTLFSMAQNAPIDQLLKPLVHPSPQSAAFTRYGEYPVDYSTGVPRIEIPLYNLDTGDYELPISLSYHASGIKVLDVSSPVGLGWVLNAGGVIGRTVCGMPDFEGYNYEAYFKNKQDVINAMNDSRITADVWNRIFVGDSQYDSEVDRYSYSFAGRSGLFRYDVYSGEPFTIPHNPIKIARTSAGFQITDTDGTIYTFEAAESCTVPGMNPYTSSWYLTRIVTGAKKNVITLNYEYGESYYIRYRSECKHKGEEVTFEEDYVTEQIYMIVENGVRYDGDVTLQSYIYRVPLLRSINWNGVNIRFKYSADREDTQKERLVSIEVKEGDEVVRHIKIGNDGYFGTSVSNYRLKLSDLTIKGDSLDSDAERYRFSYDSTTPPDHYNLQNSMASSTYCYEDYWGYYNGRQSFNMIPNGIFNTTGWADRSASPSSIKMCSLTEIVYPTGGSTTFHMECNQVGDEYIGGLRVASIVNKGSDGTILEQKSYEYSEGWATMDISNELFSYEDDLFYFIRNPNGSYYSIPRLHLFAVASPVLPLTGWSGAPVFYHTVTEYNGTRDSNAGKIVYRYMQDFESSYPGSEEDDMPVPLPLKFYSTLYNNDEGIVPALLTEKIVYKNQSGNYQKQLSEKYEYTEYSPHCDSISLGVRIGRMGVGKIYYENIYFSSAPYSDMDEYYDNIVYTTIRGYLKQRLLSGKVVTNHETGYSETYSYDYDSNLKGLKPIKEEMTGSDGKHYTFKTKYPYMNEELLSDTMTKANYIDIPVKQEMYSNDSLRTCDHTVYAMIGNRFLPQSVKRSENGVAERTLLTYNHYDSYGNPTGITTNDGKEYSILWGYNGRYPVAWIEGVPYDELMSTIGSSLLLEILSLGNLGVSHQNSLYEHFPDAHVTLYNYSPGIGMTRQVLPNGNVINYSYDNFGRLEQQSDNLGIMEQYEYYMVPSTSNE